MVEYSGGDNIFEEEIQDNIVIDNNTKVGAYPRLVPSDFFLKFQL